MTTPTPTPENQNSSEASDCSESSSSSAEVTGFFQRVRRGLKSEEQPHPTEADEIVVMEEEET